jgi:hypothetical protein
MAVKQLTRMETGGSVVELRRGDPDTNISYGSRARSFYEVWVNDVHRGYVFFANGWGGSWQALSLRPKHRYDAVYHKHDDADRTCYGLAEFYRELSPGALNEPENWGEHARRWSDRNELLAAFPKMIELGRCPSPAEAAAKLVQDKVDYAERQAEDARKAARWAAEQAQRERDKAAAAARDEEMRTESLAGLQSILDRFAAQLSNLEMVSLQRAIERFGGPKQGAST